MTMDSVSVLVLCAVMHSEAGVSARPLLLWLRRMGVDLKLSDLSLCLGRWVSAEVFKVVSGRSGQLDTLKDYGCQTIFQDKASGARAEHPGLTACLDALEEGDTLIVWRLDRLGRSMAHLVKTIEGLRMRGVAFKSISDGVIDTASPSGQLIFHIFAALAEFERGLISERTQAGLAAARARGRKPIKASDPRVRQARSLHKEGSMSVSEICESMGISKATLYRDLRIE